MRTFAKTFCVATLLALTSAWAQDGPRGHWTGNIDLPDQQMGVEIDLDKPAKDWIGSMAIPARNQTGIPLDNIAFAGGKWSFSMKGAPGAPTFTGALSADNKEMTGDFAAGGGSFPFKLTRAGDPKVELPKPSAAVEARFTGTWEGGLETPGGTLHLRLSISNGADGAKALLTSIDQGNSEMAASSIEQSGPKLTFKVPLVGGDYKGELNQDSTELTGTWTQGGGGLPLTLKKAK